jgi:hypothetical protein
VVTESTIKSANISQRSIYDQRYEAGHYDRRSAVRVLTAERDALHEAVGRALKSEPTTRRINLFDFGYGTGRVTNEFIGSYVHHYAKAQKDLRVVAYDVSSAGLMKANDVLRSAGFTPDGPLSWSPGNTAGYIVGAVSKTEADIKITVIFVHGHEGQDPKVMRRLALRASEREKFLLTTSWYSGLGHIPGEGLRREYFRQLDKITSRHGEMIISVSSTGDLAELQREYSERLAEGTVGGFPIQEPGDLIYQTELGQSNYFHVFGTELNDHMKAISGRGQHWWVEGIRYPDQEFAFREAEQANYRRVREANNSKRGRIWNADDYQEFHTVAAFRSPLDPKQL